MIPMRLIGVLGMFLHSIVHGMVVGSYNIRYDNPGDQATGNSWQQRAPIIAGLMRFHDFDVVGTQEALPHQLVDLKRLLPDYGCSAHGRDDGELVGENIAIFFKKDHFEMLDEGRFWLSLTPDEPSRGWDASLQRICGWAKLRESASGREFYFFSLHFDHRGEQARQNSAPLVLEKISEIAGSSPFFLVGDFNADQNSPTYQRLVESAEISDAAVISPVRYIPNGTANGFRVDSYTESRIDHIFVRKGISTSRFGVLTDTYRAQKAVAPEETTSGQFPEQVTFRDFEVKLPSDHFPILAEVDSWEMPPQEEAAE